MSAPESEQRPVVVGVDGSPASQDALRWAADYARLTGAPLKAVIAWHLPVSLAGGLPLPEGFDPTEDARHTLDDALSEALGESPGIAVTKQVVGGAAAAILIEESRDAAILVVGSRGRGGFAGLLLGSVSEHSARYASCPVVVVRHHGMHETV